MGRPRVRNRVKSMAVLSTAICIASALTSGALSSTTRRGSLTGCHLVHFRASQTESSQGRMVWDDEFSGPAGAAPISTKWRLETGGNGWGNGELEYYTARTSNVSLDGDGHLQIVARREHYAGPDGVTREYTSARLQTKGLFQVTYGRIEARIKLPAGRGLWPAFWAVGSNIDSVGWPASGEIDVMESAGQDPFEVSGSVHGPAAGLSEGYAITSAACEADPLTGGFHTYGVDWSPGRVVFTLDGSSYETLTPTSLRSSERWVFNGRPYYLVLDLAVGGTGAGAPNSSTQFPARMLVDWVRVYALSPRR